ncbi:MAG: hypothetical protein ACK4Q5_02105 [Saprospiraceae bacterium]
MKKSELAQTLFALRAEQLKELKRFADSDLVNRGSRRIHVAALLRHLMRLHPDAEQEGLLQANVWKALFGKKDFDKSELSKIASDALAVVKEFIIQEEHSRTAEIDRLLLLAQFYYEKDLDKFYKQTAAEIRRKLDTANLPDRWSHLESFRLEELQIEQEAKFYVRKEDPSLPAAITHIQLFYLLSKIRLCCILATHNQIASSSIESDWLITDEFLIKSCEHIPAVNIWLTAFKMFKSGDEADFLRLCELMDEYQGNMSFHDLFELASYLRLFCNRKFLASGEQAVLHQLFGLQAKHLERGYLQIENGKIPQSTLLNLVSVGIKLKRFPEVEKALATVGSNIIGADTPDRTLALNRALLAFAQGKIAEAHEIIPSHDFEDVQYQIVCRVLWMKIWYETDELDRLESEINTFRVYVHRACEEKKIITPARKEVNFAFLRFLSSLLKFKFTRPRDQILEKIAELNEKKTVADRDWLLEKMENLLKR